MKSSMLIARIVFLDSWYINWRQQVLSISFHNISISVLIRKYMGDMLWNTQWVLQNFQTPYVYSCCAWVDDYLLICESLCG